MLIPKKLLGQNFLLDKNICKKIINSTSIKNKIIIEIGPGTGQVTDQIIKQKPKKLVLIEKDENLYNILKKKYISFKNITIINGDALTYDFLLKEKINIISNLPYNISTKLIIKLLQDYHNINEMIFMVQKEVANKFIYLNKDGNNKYSLFINSISSYKILFEISNKVFYPKPKVNSCLIKIKPNKNKLNKKLLWDFSQNIFKNKRKKLNRFNNKNITDNSYNKIFNKRPQELIIKEFIDLFKFL